MQLISHRTTKRIDNNTEKTFRTKSKVKTYSCFLTILIFALISVITASIISKATSNLPSIYTPFERTLPESTQVYDKKGNVIYTIYGNENRIYTPYVSIPQTMKMAMIAAEDVNFFQEEGINPMAIMRAAFHDIFYNTDNTPIQGASTITQQLIKYTSLTSSRTIDRKIKEIVLALKIAQVYTKQQILETYLNTVPFGGNNYGIESAARAYFNKDIWQLDLAQSAFLAGLVQAPSAYSPVFSNDSQAMKYAITREHYVLDQMLIHRNITKVTLAQVNEAKAEKLTFETNDKIFNYPFFSLYVRDWLIKKYGKDTVEQNGLQVYTTLDPVLQKIGQESITSGVATIVKQGLNAHNAALVSIDSTNGNILAMIGSVDYNDKSKQVDGKVNMATSPVSPGSSIKPFVYLTAFEHGMDPSSIVDDVPTTFPDNYTPQDFDNQYEGQITIAKALLDSRNIPAVEIAQKIGLKSIYDTLVVSGFNSLQPLKSYGLSMSIGGLSTPLLDETAAYTLFSQDGIKHTTQFILKVKDKYGRIIFSSDADSNSLFPKDKVKELNDILRNYGTLTSVKTKGYDVAGKTGTGQFNKNNLFIGYSSHITTGVWVGNTDQSVTTDNTFGDNTAAPIWNSYMLQALPYFPEDSNF